MTAINFPDTPDDNDEFTSGDRTWKWNDTAGVWEAVSVAEQSVSTGKAIAMAIVFGG
jgi:hypothetical protein